MSFSRADKFKRLFKLKKVNFEVFFDKKFVSDKKSVDVKIETPDSGKPVTVAIDSTTVQSGIGSIPTKNPLIVNDSIFQPVKEKVVPSDISTFDEVPGPKVLQSFAKLWNFIPVFGNQITSSSIHYMLTSNNILSSQLNWGRNTFLFSWLLNEYGPVVRLQGPFGGNVLIISRPRDALSVFTSEGRYPIRSSLDCIEKYRIEYRHYKNIGPFMMYGEDWEKLRKQVTESLNKTAPYQFKHIETLCNNFVKKINQIKNRQEEVPPYFYKELCKWSMEVFCTVLLGQKTPFKNAALLEAFHGATDAIKRCESGLHLWKYFETPAWKALVRHCVSIDDIFEKYIKEAENNLQKKKNENKLINADLSLLEVLLLQEGASPDDILTVILDMMLIGVNSISHSMAFLFYHLARSPKSQRILTDEIKTAPEILKFQDIWNLKYMQACIKESLRLKPPIPVLSRILTKDTIISNYHVPKNTVVLIATYLSSTKEENFDDALKFIPERWLTTDNIIDSYAASIPFGYGPKACLAKNLAEMQLSLILTKVLRAFKIEYHYGDINSTNKLLALPDKPLRFRFVNRIY